MQAYVGVYRAMRHALVGILSTFLILVLSCEAMAERRVALVIGNGAYTETVPLANSPNDANDIAQALGNLDFQVVKIVDGDKLSMERAIRKFGTLLRGADVALFFYAGHGLQVDGHNYLLPVDAMLEREQDLPFETIPVSLVLRQMEAGAVDMKLVILDACRNNPLATRLARSVRALGRSAEVGRGLAKIDGATGTLIAFATAPGEVAFEGTGRNSPFTTALLQWMPQPDLEVGLMFRRIRQTVMDQTKRAQVPWVNESLTGEFYFAGLADSNQASPETQAAKPAPVTPPVAAPSSATPAFDIRVVELAFWESIKDSDNPKMFEAYLERYPDGLFGGVARVKIEELRQLAALPPAEHGAVAPEAATPDTAVGAPAPETIERGLGLSREERGLVQRALNDLKHEAGVEDGIFGSRTRKAIRAWQVASTANATSYLTGDQAKALIARGREVQVAVGTYEAPTSRAMKPGETFRDCPDCPEMVVVPAGSFMMGSPVTEVGRSGNEGPQHRVTISQPFAVGRYEVTFDEWNMCVADGGCDDYRLDDKIWGRGRRPVINVSWHDAKAYVAWLSQETGKAYRLLSEAEWEYAARAGTRTRNSFGDEISRMDANFGRGLGKTSKVGSYPANPWKLHDMHGNVWEWVEDCWHESYDRAPSDGSAWTWDVGLGIVPAHGDCSLRVLRGGSWNYGPRSLRSANRYMVVTGIRVISNGFRVARTLP